MSTDPDADFGLRVRRARTSRDLTLRELAALSGVSYSRLCRIENGQGTTLHSAAMTAAGLGVPLAALVSPVPCPRCCGEPPPGFACLECGRGAVTVDIAAFFSRRNKREGA